MNNNEMGSSSTIGLASATRDGTASAQALSSKFNPAAWFGGRAQPSSTSLVEVDSADGIIMSRATEKTFTRTLSAREKRDCAVIG
jgi:hypothetical protein